MQYLRALQTRRACCFSLLRSQPHASRHFTLSAPLSETERTNEEGTSINLGRRKRAKGGEAKEEEGGEVPFKRNEGRKASASVVRLSVSTLNYARIGRRRRWTARDAHGGAFCTPRSRSRQQSACSLADFRARKPKQLSPLPPSLAGGLFCRRATKPTASFPRCSLPSLPSSTALG